MNTICDLPAELLEDEIFYRLPITSLRSVRSTCKKWNTLCKNRIFLGKEAKNQFLMMDSRIRLMNFVVSEQSIKQVSVLDQIQIFQVFEGDGLLLCVLRDCSRLLVWNPYLGQTRWIELRNSFQSSDTFALGYDNNSLNHKILRISNEFHPVTSRHGLGFELYDFSSSSWKVLDDVTPERRIWTYLHRGVSLKGNTYFPTSVAGFFVCFDFATESFRPLLPLPGSQFATFSCVREEQQLAVLCQPWEAREMIEISVTDKIGPDVVSWTKFLKLNTGFWIDPSFGSFLVDKEKKLAVVFVIDMVGSCCYHTAHFMGQDGYYKSVRSGVAPPVKNASSPHISFYPPPVCSSYLPSLVQLTKQPG